MSKMKSADDGKFVSKETASKNPKTTYRVRSSGLASELDRLAGRIVRSKALKGASIAKETATAMSALADFIRKN